jgi:phosphoserine phosphatase RsbU/P
MDIDDGRSFVPYHRAMIFPVHESSARIEVLQQLLAGLSLASSPQNVLQLMSRHYWQLRPVDYMLSLSCRNLKPGEFRITRRLNPPAFARGEIALEKLSAAQNPLALPVHSGGMLSTVIGKPFPTSIADFRCENDPVVGNELASFRSMIALPLFHEGEPVYWTIQFRREPGSFSDQEIEHAWFVGNLIGGANTRLLLMNEVKQLNDQLTRQFDEVARVQRSLLPRQTPEVPGLAIASSYLTSQQAGGDYYDFLNLPGGRLGILIADVAGHGAAAATVMAMLHAILHAYDGPTKRPDQILAYANSRLVSACIEGTFVTAFLGIYDPATGVLEYSRAGHNPPILRRAHSDEIHVVSDAAALPLGVLDPYEGASSSVTLEPGDLLVLYTDGVTEAMPIAMSAASGEMFGTTRLNHAIHLAGQTRCMEGGMPDKIVEEINDALYQHTQQLTRADDQTIVVLQRLNQAHHAVPVQKPRS